MNFSEIEKKWQKRWAEAKLYQSKLEQNKDNAYVLVMFSYPSGDKLHVGHWYNFGPTDTYARFLRMTGKNVFEPMGFDAFGLPAENYAIKTGIHPAISTKKNISVMTEQLKAIGAMYDWDKTLVTCDESYYKWNQWLFLQLYKKGLAYRKEAPVNWCPKDKTVLANEQVINGCCERCDTKVIRKNLTQWFFKITEYAEQLLDGLNVINWPESTKAKQREWIGKSHGAEIVFSIKDSDQTITAFTTRPDTLFGATYLTLAPEHDILNTIVSPEQKDKVQQYQVESSQRSEIDRLSDQNKTGVFTGAYAINPINGEEMPIWISDYVLSTYGTGAIMAVPAHDQRDFDFAKKFDLKIKQVINPHGESIADKVIEQAYTEDGNLINSEEFDGLTIANAKEKIVQSLASAGKAVAKTNYKLRDWLISRQRYWGTPIPIIYCDDCGAVPVAETDLPVKLPLDVEFHPDGDSPLKNSSSFQNVSCPKCGKAASRETDTMDTFVCSSWYYLRYLDPTNDNEAINSDLANRWTPVDMYVGGADHAVMHLLYARFIHKALRDMGHVNSDEPFKSLIHQGMILGPDGQKMSKSKGNVVSPDEYVQQYGADAFRCSLMFGFAYELGGPWDDGAIGAVNRFIKRLIRMVEESAKKSYKPIRYELLNADEKQLLRTLHNSIKLITDDLERLQFNTSISRLMEIVNEYYRFISLKNHSDSTDDLLAYSAEMLVRLFAPFAPHISEELWESLGKSESVFLEKWPAHNEYYLEIDQVNYVLQINGKIRAELLINKEASNNEIERIAMSNQRIIDLTQGKTIRKVIIVPKRLVNIVVS